MNKKAKGLCNFFLLIFFTFLSACSFTGGPPGLSNKVPSTYKNKIEKKGLKLEKAEYWWLKFNDPTLNTLIERAFKENFNLKEALFRLTAAEAEVKKANATLWPEFSGHIGGGQRAFGNKSSSNYQYGIQASYEIDVFQRLKNYRSQKVLEKEATKEDVKALLLSLSSRVAETYYQIIKYNQKIKVQKEINKELEKTYELVRLRYLNGLVTSLDVYQAHQNLMANKALIPVYEERLEANKNALSILLGKPPSDSEIECLVNSLTRARLPELTIWFDHGLPSELLKNRPDIRSSYLRLYAQDKRLAQALSDLFPRFELSAIFSGENMEPGHLFDYREAFWQVFLRMTQPIFMGGRLRAQVEIELARLKELSAKYESTVLNAFKEVEDILSLEKRLKEHLEILKKRLKDLEKSIRLSLFRYSYGISDFLPVLQAQTSYQTVIQDIISKEYELIAARIGLAKVIGGRWMENELEKLRAKNIKNIK